MVLAISLQTLTLIHVLVSLFGIGSGLVVMCGFLTNKRLDGWTALFLTTTTLTSITGFLFPFVGVTPAIKLGVISMVVLAITIVTRYPLHLTWRKTYVITASAVLYFNVFVLGALADDKRRRNASWCSGCDRSSGRLSFSGPTVALSRNSCARPEWEGAPLEVSSYCESYQLKYAKVQLSDSFGSHRKLRSRMVSLPRKYSDGCQSRLKFGMRPWA